MVEPERAETKSSSDAVVMGPAATVRRLVPVARLDSWITPVDNVYVIAHMGIARIDLQRWRLTVDGLVERAVTLDYRELTSLPSREVTAVIECFGNPVQPDVPTRRVGNVVWRGVPLAEVLTRAGVQAGADAVWLEGLDFGTFAGMSSDRYLKDLPLDRALEGDVLLAWQMNGAALTPEHGFPVRVFVPGYFGTNAVKWLARIQVARGRPEGLFTTRLYNRRVVGATWLQAQIAPPELVHAWQRFALDWPVEAPGAYQIACRACDAKGRIQPFEGRNRVHVVNVRVT